MKSLLTRFFAVGLASFALFACGPVDESSDANVDTEELFEGASDLGAEQFSSGYMREAFFACCLGTGGPYANCGPSYQWVSKCTEGAASCVAGTQPNSGPTVSLHSFFKYYDSTLQRWRGYSYSCNAMIAQ